MSLHLFWSILVAAVPVAAQGAEPVTAVAVTPAAQLAELVAADKAFAEKARDLPFPDAVGAMLAPDAVMPARGSKPFLRSRDEIIAYLKANPATVVAHAEWMPVRGGISADGRQGFTAGYLTITQPDGTKQPGKYMTYWGRTIDGWRALAYKRAPRPEGAVDGAFHALGLPDPAKWRGPALRNALDTLLDAERAFAAKAQIIGVGPAFAEYGRADAINMGAGAGYTESAAAIAAGFDPEPEPGKTIEWGPDFGIVSASGDLGVSFGRITPKQRLPGLAPDAPVPASPFFTIWHRDTPTGPWRYIAE